MLSWVSKVWVVVCKRVLHLTWNHQSQQADESSDSGIHLTNDRERLSAKVDMFLQRHDDSFRKNLFDKYAVDFSISKIVEKRLIFPRGLVSALAEFCDEIKNSNVEGIDKTLVLDLNLDDAAHLVASITLGERGGLEMLEFQRLLSNLSARWKFPITPASRLEEIFECNSKKIHLHTDLETNISENVSLQTELTKMRLVFPAGLKKAFDDLEISKDLKECAALVASMDLDENGGLDLEEFSRVISQPPSPLEQWISTLPLSAMLAACLETSESNVDPLLAISRLDSERMSAAIEAFSYGMRLMIGKAQTQLIDTFARMDAKAQEAADGSAAKFKTFKMSTGKVSDYFKGLAERIG